MKNRILYGLVYSDMRFLATMSGNIDTIDFNRLVESLCIVQMEIEMEGSYLTPDERTMMEDKQRNLRRDVAATVISSMVRMFLAGRRMNKFLQKRAEDAIKYK